jgi:hypothetical protein
MILVLSETSRASRWVATELRRALELERKTKNRKIFPIRITSYEKIASWRLFDADAGEDLAVRVREYFIPDFTDWKDSLSFRQAATRLRRDLEPDAKFEVTRDLDVLDHRVAPATRVEHEIRPSVYMTRFRLGYWREIIRERTNAGLAAARARGRTGGRRPKMTPGKLASG